MTTCRRSPATMPRTRCASPSVATAATCSSRSRITGSGSRRRTRTGSSSGSTRSTGPGSAAAGRASGWRSRATSWSSTAAGSASSRRRAGVRRSLCRCRCRPEPVRRSPAPDRLDVVDRLRVATLNIRNLADRWDERLPLLLADMAALQPDLLGLQEVVYPLQQDRLIGAAGDGRYAALRAWAGRPEYGNALLIREPLSANGHERMDLGTARSALAATVPLEAGETLRMVVTHLHHVTADESIRDDQTRELVAWLDGLPPVDATVVVGDFNA